MTEQRVLGVRYEKHMKIPETRGEALFDKARSDKTRQDCRSLWYEMKQRHTPPSHPCNANSMDQFKDFASLNNSDKLGMPIF